MQTLNQDIKTKEFKRVYLLYGDEPFLVSSYKKRLKEAIAGEDTMNFNYFEGKSPDVHEIISLADTMPFFADRRLILIDGSGFFKSAPEELVEYLPQIPDTTCMVFCESEVDKRNRLFKKVKETGYAAELGKQNTDQLMKWAVGILAKDGRKITRPVMEYFLGRTGDDMENIRMELEKLICYTMGREVITKEDVDAVGTVHVSNRIFDMVAAIVSGNTKKAMDLYEDLLSLKGAADADPVSDCQAVQPASPGKGTDGPGSRQGHHRVEAQGSAFCCREAYGSGACLYKGADFVLCDALCGIGGGGEDGKAFRPACGGAFDCGEIQIGRKSRKSAAAPCFFR